MRGFSIIALDNPKCAANVGGVMRACGCYDSQMLVVAAAKKFRYGRLTTDTTRAYRHMPLVHVADVFDALPHDTIPVAVDLLDGAEMLPTFKHPERAFYIFGAEDATLGSRIVDRCKFKIAVPTKHCMNLAATVNVVLYDRIAKRGFQS